MWGGCKEEQVDRWTEGMDRGMSEVVDEYRRVGWEGKI